VVSATNHDETNRLVAKTAEQQNTLVNVVDNPELCSFIFPAIIDRSPIIAAVSSSGAAPILARLLRAKIETIIPPAYGRLAALANKLDIPFSNTLKTPSNGEFCWEQVLQGNIAELIFAGKDEQAEQQLQQQLSSQEIIHSWRSLFDRRRTRCGGFINLSRLTLFTASRCRGL